MVLSGEIFDKNEERSLPRNVWKQIFTARRISTQDISQKNFKWLSIFLQQILKRNLRKKKSLNRNLYQINLNSNLYHKVFDNLVSTKNIEGEISTK